MTDLFKWQLESAQKYDDSERNLGDVLDVKASVALVAVTFLASVSAQLITMQGLSPQWNRIQLPIQIVALLLIALAGSLLIAELWPRDYLTLPTPNDDAKWIDELSAVDDNSGAVLETVLSQKLGSAMRRVEHNKEINDKKSKLLWLAFKLIASALALVLGNLLCLTSGLICPLIGS